MCCLRRWRKKIGPVPPDIVEEDTFRIPILEGKEDLRLFESHIAKYRSHMSHTFMGILGDVKLYYTYEVHERFVILRNALTFDLECLEKSCDDDVLIEKCKNKVDDLNGLYKMKMYQTYIEDALILGPSLENDPILRETLTYDGD